MDESERIILKAALSPTKDAADGWLRLKNSIDQSEMPNLLNWCGGYIYKNLKALGIEDHYLKGIYKHNWTSNTYRLQRLSRILTEISKVSVITPIKSFGLNSKHFNLGLRSIGDFDFFFDLKDFESISKILKEHQYKLFMGISEEELKDKIFTSRGSWSYKNGPIDDLDLHWKIFDELTVQQNQELVMNNSAIKLSNWGQYREMSSELSVITISHHQYLQGGINFSALCDLKQMIDVSDLPKVYQLAKVIGMTDILKSQLDNISEIIEDKEITYPKLVPSIKSRNKDQILDFIQEATLRTPGIYRLWLKLGAKSKIEMIFIRFFGVFSNPNSYMRRAESFVEKTENLILGSGWHYRYPGNDYQWSTYPDTRVVIQSVDSKRLEIVIQLDPSAWSISVPNRIECFMNGKFVNTFDKSQNTVNLTVTTRTGDNELSFRSPKPWNKDLTGIAYNWQRLQMPVKSIKAVG